jgi:hypothetical protein
MSQAAVLYAVEQHHGSLQIQESQPLPSFMSVPMALQAANISYKEERHRILEQKLPSKPHCENKSQLNNRHQITKTGKLRLVSVWKPCISNFIS